jgi:hypothetical protein
MAPVGLYLHSVKTAESYLGSAVDREPVEAREILVVCVYRSFIRTNCVGQEGAGILLCGLRVGGVVFDSDNWELSSSGMAFDSPIYRIELGAFCLQCHDPLSPIQHLTPFPQVETLIDVTLFLGPLQLFLGG